MIERQKGKFIIQCDSCGNAHEDESYFAVFADFWSAKRRDGWEATKIGDEWTHKCPECDR